MAVHAKTGADMAGVVQFENVGLRYGGGGPEVLSDVTFSLGRGGFCFLTGASGAGKTSLLKLLYLSQRPSRGLVADEPTGNVDADMAERLLQLFDATNRLGTTVVVATYDLHLLGRVPHAAMLRLDKGRLLDPTGALRHPPPEIVQ